ncbi:nitrilase and fragile histidine triad fusion protein NitFhit isoform X1 [Tribolium castaneum]|nr:PREDICTED: nitrilase and fragile histidine triad fusion protein NitFhit isoform X1 [Tribolium castaneum]|eukprot:XP_975421.2 PREDICTED: nitrilase and fragile histidine triad fusion protein NitFhit isoform X1 [Tribolium castaneum]
MSIIFKANLIKLCRVTLNQNYRMSAPKCSVAVCQFTATNNKENNLQIVKQLVSEAAQKQAKIVFLPEASDYIAANKNEAKAFAEPLNGTLMNEYRNLAKTRKVWLSVGGFHELVNEHQIFNTHVLIDDEGEIKSVYKKLHLFDVSIPELNVNLRESDLNEAGRHLVPPVMTPAGPLALAICYDLRFPELSIIQRKQGANILTYPSAFTKATGALHWETLLRSRAIETQCYVIAAAQYGKHNEKRTSYGQALIVDPQGKIIAECPKYREGHETNQSIAIAEIDSNLIQKVRTEMPVFQHRRSDIYQLQVVGGEKIPINDEETFSFAHKIIPASTVFYRTRHCYAFTNIRCVVPGHVLISTVRCCKRLEDLTSEEVTDLFLTAVKVQKAVENEYSASSSTLCVQDGKHAGQTIPHVHIHILPRKPNDFEVNDEIYDRLAKHDREESQEPLRNVTEMSQEADTLRKYFYQ